MHEIQNVFKAVLEQNRKKNRHLEYYNKSSKLNVCISTNSTWR